MGCVGRARGARVAEWQQSRAVMLQALQVELGNLGSMVLHITESLPAAGERGRESRRRWEMANQRQH